MSPTRTVQSRRAYRTADYNYLLIHYTSSTKKAKACASELGRSVGSLKSFISAHPELKKRGRV
ncbi:hypothetical protein [Hymenobacter cellulosivorans]|uniref:N-acetylmuramoyl-L-alanine amidase n=1 Tax=Hymenobacter cellulosivorans TaxID=2932249 RepID=A0ABY4FA62_9BACT|nr:hypothetical protein [Hymenobacter cellulosivorans]UOQ53071.1 hypothetical protein MUN80_25455 [Hymenobacter cellulosivorans]